MTLAARDFTSSLNRASGQAARMTKDSGFSHPFVDSFQQAHVSGRFFVRILKRQIESSPHSNTASTSRV